MSADAENGAAKEVPCDDSSREAGILQMPASVSKTILVVGLGMVGIAFIEKILNLDETKRYRLVTCGEEAHLAYNRVALTEYFQHRSVEKLYLNQVEWYAQQDPDRFIFYTGEQVTSLDTAGHSVTTSRGRVINYDHCVLATGSESTLPPYLPPERVAETRGIFVYRNISDLDNILNYSQEDHVKGCRAVVVGGGLLGLEAAKAVFDLETIGKVGIINRQAYPLSRQLDDDGGEIVLRRIEAMGVDVLTKTTVEDIVTTPEGVLSGLILSDGTQLDTQMVIYAIGITPRDDLARKAGLKCRDKGGITVDDYLKTSAPDVYAIGECASWQEHTFGLIGPGVEMADILSFNLTQVETDIGGFKPRQMNMPDLSTKLKLMGVDVASFGDYFADKRALRGATVPRVRKVKAEQTTASHEPTEKPAREIKTDTTAEPQVRHRQKGSTHEIECLTYKDPFSFVYKKYIFTADGKYLLGGMMVGDTSDYVKLISLVKKKKAIEVPPSQFIVGSGKKGEEDGADLDDDTQVCSCHNVTKGAIVECVKSGMVDMNDVKSKTKAGTGCGGCMPLVTNIFKAEMKNAGHAISNNLCIHFAMTRQELFTIIKLRKLKTFPEILTSAGVKPDSLGCEICRPAVASILSSLYNELVMTPSHHANQDTNDKWVLSSVLRGRRLSHCIGTWQTYNEMEPFPLSHVSQEAR
jgi:nitrite reductase (NAD(P)H)